MMLMYEYVLRVTPDGVSTFTVDTCEVEKDESMSTEDFAQNVADADMSVDPDTSDLVLTCKSLGPLDDAEALLWGAYESMIRTLTRRHGIGCAAYL